MPVSTHASLQKLAGLQVVTALVEWPQAVVETESASRADIGLFKSSGRGFLII
jgi:hypothetical protein